MRRTKIVATLGPATDDPKIVEGLVRAGVDVVRLNFSHGTAEQHERRAVMVRAAAAKAGRYVGILGDLQGPKIRIACFRDGGVDLAEGDPFILDASLAPDAGDRERVGLTYKGLPGDVGVGDMLLLDDGRIVLRVEGVDGDSIRTTTVVGGMLSDSKGINRQGGGLSASALTDKDRDDIRTAARIDVDYLAVSFPRSAADITTARALLREAGGHGGVMAKIERAEAIDNVEEIMDASDAVMIARGDLGVEIGDAELPSVQKSLIHTAREMNRVVVTATQMMESMIHNQIPTRAEVFDVANAVIDGTDAVMLSGETATGLFPIKVVKAMARICEVAERNPHARISKHRMDCMFERVDEAVAMATMYVANHLDVRAIAALTESGATPLWMSRISSGIPIYGLSQSEFTLGRMTLFRGVYPVYFDTVRESAARTNNDVAELLLAEGVAQQDDLVIVTKGDVAGMMGGTNAMKIIRVGTPGTDDAG